jgi:peptidoglycan/LPS O-acetylase OafA/YrhL
MAYFGELATGRDNNLNLIRAVAASLVLVSHAYPIALGPEVMQPLQALTGYTLGTVSVFAFFAISGYLITASFERSSSRHSFLTARFLRLFPGLVVSLLVVALILGPAVSSLTPGNYLSDPGTWLFVIKNLALMSPQYTLPGVFESNPYTTVEGSLWTLFYEVVCYGGVFVGGVMGLWRRKFVAGTVLLAYLALWLGVDLAGIDLPGKVANLRLLSLPFVIGMGFYVYRQYIPLNLIGLVLLGVITWAVKGTLLYGLMFSLGLSYGVFWLAYVPGGLVRAYNNMGDYSYGIYIYAFPFQGLAVWLFGVQSPLENMLYSFPMTLLASIVSWHLIEGPALRMKSRVVAILRPA